MTLDHYFTPRRKRVKEKGESDAASRRSVFACLFIALAAASLLCAAPLHAQPQGEPPEGASSESTTGLGGLFAESLKQMLQSGNVITPNGESAKPVPSEPGEPEKFKLNFNNAPVDQVLKFLSDMNKKLVLKTPEVQGQFTIMNPNEVTREEAMKIIDTAFRFQDITFEETDEMIIVLPMSAAKLKLGGIIDESVDGEPSSRVQSKIIELKYADPSQIKEALTPLLSESSTLIADERTSTLVMTDTAANIERLEGIIRQLDKETTKEGVSMRVFKLRYLDAREMARNLDNMLQNIVMGKLSGGSLRDRRDQAQYTSEVIADRDTNSLIIAAPDFAIETIADFIQKMDTSSIQNMDTRTVVLKNTDARELAQGLQQFAQSRRTSFYQPVIFADSRSNSIVIHAYPEDADAIVNVLNELDQKQAYDRTTRVYILENADAFVISDMVQQLLTGEDARNSYSYWGYGRRQQEEDQITIVEDQRLNALIVSARPSDFPMVEDLIEALDQPLPQSKEEPRVYPVKNVRATDLAYMLEEIFADDGQGSYPYFGRNQQQTQITGLSGKIKTIADPTTNSLIVLAASPRAFGIIESLIEQLDRVSPEFGTTRVFNLKNSDSGYLADQLNSLFEEDGSQQGNRGFFWYNNRQSTTDQPISNMIGQVRIVSETRTNSLMVTTSSQYFDAIEKLIEDLDRNISQILVEILIVEIIDSNDDQLGINWGDNIQIYADASLDSPFSEINMDRAAILSTAKYDAVIDFLSSNSKTNVLARPNILTGDNQQAFIESVNRIPRLGELSQSTSSTNQSIAYEEPGLKLYVTPHINDATTVTIDVDLETGQVLQEFALVTPSGTAPAMSRRVVQT
ncbi:MAG: secretin N-terminal domain-containing protein, partial [Candidatus Hinthialibacter sp.]